MVQALLPQHLRAVGYPPPPCFVGCSTPQCWNWSRIPARWTHMYFVPNHRERRAAEAKASGHGGGLGRRIAAGQETRGRRIGD